MGWLNTEKPPEKWSAAYFKAFVERLRTAVNFIDSSNFKNNQISGVLLTNRSVALNQKVTGYGGIMLYEDFFALMSVADVVATTVTQIGSPVLYTPTTGALSNVFLEVTGYSGNAGNVCTVEVYSADGLMLSQTFSDVTLTRREWQIPAEKLPTTSGTFILKAKTANASYPLKILSARVIFKLTETTT